MKTTARQPHATMRLLFAAVLGVLALLAAGVGAPPPRPRRLSRRRPCWKDVVNDWLRNQPNLKGTYAIPCYTQAIQHLSSYPDLAGYSSAADDIHARSSP